MLLKHGAAAYPRDRELFLPSELARENGHEVCASIIENYFPPAAITTEKLWFHNVNRDTAEKLLRSKG